MKLLIVGTGAAIALAGGTMAMGAGSGQDGENMTAADVAAAAANSDIRPLPGEYRVNMTLLSIDIPDAPPQMAGMMSQIMSRSFEYCLTQEDVEQGFKEMTRKSQDGECNYQRFSANGGEIDAEMTCTTDGRTMTMEMEGTGTATSSDITMTMSGDMGMGPGSMKLRAVHERIGKCGG